jgi:hypothetical protein
VLHNIFKLVFSVTILVSDVSTGFHKENNAREQKLNEQFVVIWTPLFVQYLQMAAVVIAAFVRNRISVTSCI